MPWFWQFDIFMSEVASITVGFERSYAAALASYMLRGGEGPLQEAYELGRKSFAKGYGVLDMISLYHGALAKVLVGHFSGKMKAEAMARAGEFFAECMSPFEMTHRAVVDANAALRRLNDTLEEEVRRIAIALHDDAGQLMVIAQFKLDEAADGLPSSAQGKMREVKAMLDRVDERIRHLSHELHPAVLDFLGLVPAVEFLASNFMARTGLRITVHSTLQDRLPPRLAIALYRIVQEALTNIRRHANASTVRIRISKDGRSVRCVVADDGVGFNADEVLHSGLPTLGLRGILERLQAIGGRLRIRSARGQGSKLEVTVPYSGGEI
ncbi:MAG: ATP-binding protein [Acidobacteriota bacterium]